MLGEVNAAIDGATEAGATQILVNDSHSLMRNLPPGELGGQASYLSGRFKPLYMMEGLDASYDVALFLGYHAAMPTPEAADARRRLSDFGNPSGGVYEMVSSLPFTSRVKFSRIRPGANTSIS